MSSALKHVGWGKKHHTSMNLYEKQSQRLCHLTTLYKTFKNKRVLFCIYDSIIIVLAPPFCRLPWHGWIAFASSKIQIFVRTFEQFLRNPLGNLGKFDWRQKTASTSAIPITQNKGKYQYSYLLSICFSQNNF
jgi:predicted ABC-type exoprotein transport system permease subunit